MKLINTIHDLSLSKREDCICVFTKGKNLNISNNVGYSGNWVIKSNSSPKYIIIYLRHLNYRAEGNEIFVGTVRSIEGPIEDGNRYRINFINLKKLGVTHSNWKVFSMSGSNPVRYFRPRDA